ncbi:MAG: glycosyltransferase [Bacilli bacterium]|nr:glycosyltransferase [Bacilli bacterium]
MARKKNIKIAGIVTLYNPTDQDIKNINTYLDDLDKLYIIDNTEGKDNKKRIPKNEKIKYQFKNENVGVATALNMGAEFAIKEGYSYLLTMDQDTTFKPGVMEKLKEVMRSTDMKDIAIVTPWHNTKLLDQKPKEEFDDPHDVMTSGNILNLDIWKKLGGFKDEFFIDGIDIEYCLNIHKNGYKILRVNSVEIDHNLGDIFYKKIRGRLFLCTNHAAFRRYYIMRNYHYICDMYQDYDPKYCYSLVSQRHNMIGVLLFEKDKYRKIKNYIKGYLDYKKGIKGKIPSNKT